MDLETEFSFFPSLSRKVEESQELPVQVQQQLDVQLRMRGNGAALSAENDDRDDSDTVSSVDEYLEIESVASSVEDRLSWRGRLQSVIHSLPVQIFVLCLVVLDALIVLFELLLDVGAFNNRECDGGNEIEQADYCHYDLHFRSGCPPSPVTLNKGENLTAGNGVNYCICAFRKGKYTCATIESEHELHQIMKLDPARVLHFASLVILTVFIIEIVLKLIAFRMKYFTHKFEVLDGIVVVVAWILDVSSSAQEEAFFQLGALIIILRLWRVIRIVNGGVLSAKTRSDKQLQNARSHARDVVHALHKAQKKLSLQQDDIKKLTTLLNQHNILIPSIGLSGVGSFEIIEYPYDKEEGIDFNTDNNSTNF